MNHDCPPKDQLTSFVHSNIDHVTAEQICEHVAKCEACEETVVELEREQTAQWMELNRVEGKSKYENESAYLTLMASNVTSLAGDGNSSGDHAEKVHLPLGEQLRDYHLIEKIGEGGMGAVYKANHTRLGKTVAVKILSGSRFVDHKAVERFEREMTLVGRLDHPNIVRATDAGEENGRHYLVMEFIDGETLSDLVRRRGPLSIHEACRVTVQAAHALHYAHELELVHRDVKPSNMMVTESVHGERTLKLLDLGLALLKAPTADLPSDLTTTGQVMGTIDYMAPEQADNTHTVDRRADIYSLGASLYYLLTSQAPFGGVEFQSTLKKIHALAAHEPPSIRTLRPDVPEELGDMIHRMLAKDPRNRFASTLEAAAAIAPFCESQSAQLPTSLTSPRSAQQTSAPARGRRWHRNWLLSSAAAFGLLLLGVVLILRDPVRGPIKIEGPDGVTIRATRVDKPTESHEFTVGETESNLKIGVWKITFVGEGFDQFELHPNFVTIIGADGATVRITERTPERVSAANANREFAKWFLTLTAENPANSISVTSGGVERPIETASELPSDFTVTSVKFENVARSGGLERLKGLADLKTLVLYGLPQDADLSTIHVESLHSLGLAFGTVDAATISSLRHSKTLQIFSSQVQGLVTPDVLHLLHERFPNLRHLLFARGDKITLEFIDAINKFDSLKAIGLQNSKVPATCLDALSRNTSIQVISSLGCEFDDERSLRHLARMPQLRTLELYECELTGEFLEAFHRTALNQLALSGISNKDTALKHLENIPSLTEIHVIGPHWTSADLLKIAKFGNVANLKLYPVWTSADLSMMEHLRSMPGMTVNTNDQSIAVESQQVAAWLLGHGVLVDGQISPDKRIKIRRFMDLLPALQEFQITRLKVVDASLNIQEFAAQLARLNYTMERLELPEGASSTEELKSSQLFERFEEVRFTDEQN